MAVTFEKKNAYAGRVYPFHTEPVKRDVMGYKLTGVAAGTVVTSGTPIAVNDDNKTAVICKHAKVVKKVSTTKFVVEFLGHLAVGDKLYASDTENPTLSEISAIDASTKEITLKAANSQWVAGTIVLEGKTDGDNTVPVNVPNRIVARTQTMTETDRTISATHSAVVIKNVVDYPAEYLNSTTYTGTTTLVGCPLILFVKQ